MKKLIYTIFVLSLCFANISAEEVPEGYHYWFGPGLELKFLKNNKVLFYTCGENPDTIYDYTLEYKGGIPFITIPNGLFPKFSKTHIFLYNKNFCAFYGSNEMLYTDGISDLSAMEGFTVCDGWSSSGHYIKATKELVEGNITYSAYNVSAKKIDKVWAVPNNGIQESIIFGYADDNQNEENLDEIIEYEKKYEYLLIICSGYISYRNPNLYKENARPKKIKIKLKDTYAEDMEDYIIELKDTPQPQIVKIDHRVAKPITITILDVYEGEKYSDLCISKIWAYSGYKLEH